MKKKGFTLIELLAVILILAIIAVIVTPIISNIIDEAKVQSDKRSAEKFVRAAQTFFMESQMDDEKADLLNTNILDVLDLENVDAVGSVVAYSDGTVDMAIVIGKRCYTKTASQDLKDIQVSKDIDNCYVASSSIKVASINSGTDSIVITVDNTDPSITMTSCKYGTARGELNNDGIIDGNTCTIPESVLGKRYYYKITFSDGTTRSGSVQGQAGLINPNINTTPGNGDSGSGGSGNGGSGNGGSNTPSDPWGGVAAPVMEGENGQTIYTGNYLAHVKTFYFNVTTGEKCSLTEFNSNGGGDALTMTSGCLRFYAYMEDSQSYTAIMDRNILGSGYQSSTWACDAASCSNGNGPTAAAATLKSLTSSWKGTITPSNYVFVKGATPYEIPYDTDGYHARLITTDEIAHITKNENFDPHTAGTNNWFYLDGYALRDTDASWHTQVATSEVKSAFYWLYDYLNNSVNYGSYSSYYSNNKAYWTSDAVATHGSYPWVITTEGALDTFSHFNYSNNINYIGIRPVISVLKSALQ